MFTLISSSVVCSVFFNFVSLIALSKSLRSKDVWIKDNVFTENEIRDMKSLLSQDETVWKFQPREDNNLAIAGRTKNLCSKACYSCYSWSSNLTSVTFKSSSSWRKVSDTLSSHIGIKGNCRILSLEGKINIRAGHTCTERASVSDKTVNSYIAVIFLVQNSRRNAYGELIVYNEGEIIKAVYPKRGRLVIFPASLEHVIKSPAIDMSERLYCMKIHFLLSDDQRHSAVIQETLPGNTVRNDFNNPMVFPNFKLLTKTDTTPDGTLDIQQFVTKNFTTNSGLSIVVLDGILPLKELDALRKTVETNGYSDNAAGMDSTDQVQWIMAFEIDDFVQTSLWNVVSQIVTFVSGKKGYFPYDIGCNNIQATDTTTIHIDSEFNESEFTLLIYLNEDWTANHHGETVFFDDMEGNEVIFAVRPRYGRVAIFHGSIPHSARPPPLLMEGMVTN